MTPAEEQDRSQSSKSGLTPPEDGVAADKRDAAAVQQTDKEWPPSPYQSGDEPPSDAKSDARNVAMFWLSIATYVLFGLLVRLIPFSPKHINFVQLVVLMVAPTLVFMLLQLWVPWAMVRIRQPVGSQMWQAGLAAAIWIVLIFVFFPRHAYPQGLNMALVTVTPVAMTIGLSMMGALLARIVREAKILLPLGFIAGLIDIVGAMTHVGFTANVMQHHPEVVSRVSVAVPAVHGLHVLSYIGPGDVLFVAFFFAVVQQHQLNTRWTFRMVYLFLTLSMLAVQFTPIPAIGALAPMGIAVIISNARYFEFTRAEKFAMLYAALMAIAGSLAFFFYTNALFHRHP